VLRFIAENRKAIFSPIKTFFLVAFLAFSSQAEPLPSKEQPKEWSHQFTAGLESFQYQYRESTPEHKKFMQYDGMIYGVNGAYQLTYKDRIFVRPEARGAYGHADYSTDEGEDEARYHTPSMILEPRLLVGGNIPITTNFQLSPYTGLGFRYKWDDSSDIKSKANVSGSKRINKLWYLPIGTRFQYDFSDRWFVQGLAEYDWIMRGEQLGYEKHSSPSPLVVKQKSGWGLKSELLVGHHFDKVSVAFGPYLQYWKIRKSNTITRTYYDDDGTIYYNQPVWEPKNKTQELGVKLNFIF
jgi:hypothetical protein